MRREGVEKRKEEKKKDVDVFYIRERRKKEVRRSVYCEIRDSRLFIRAFYR
jgi:hypothetical protein